MNRVMDHIHARRARAGILCENLFGEPAWDMILDLFVAARTKRLVTVWNACLAARVPGTTGLRYLKLLEREGDVVRSPDPGDRRRFHVRLSDRTYARLEAWAEAL